MSTVKIDFVDSNYIPELNLVEMLCRKIKVYNDENYIRELSGTSLEEFINSTVTSDAVRAIISHMVLCHCGLRPEQVSALFYISFCISSKGIAHQLPTEQSTMYEFRIKGGAQKVCNRILEEIGRDSIFINEPVRSVTTTQYYIEVVTKHTTYNCFYVIVAVPPKDVLNISFSPQLSEKHIQALQKTCTSMETSFVATYPAEFWKYTQLGGECYFFDKSTRGPFSYCISISTPSKAAIMGKIFEDRVTNDKLPIYRSEVIRQLGHYLGNDGLYPLDYYEKSWVNSSCRMAGWQIGIQDYFNQISMPCNSVSWAGAETTPEWYGLMAGAIHSGTRAALESLYAIRPQVLNSSDMSILDPSRRRARMPISTYYGETLYTAVENWKLIVSVCLVVLVALWRIKVKYLMGK